MYSKIWKNAKFLRLSQEAKHLFFYVLTSPHGNMIGFYHLPNLYIAADVNLPIGDVQPLINEIVTQGLIEYDKEAEVVLIPSWFEHNPLSNENQVKGARSALSEVPRNRLLNRFETVSKGFGNRYETICQTVSNSEEETEEETETEGRKATAERIRSLYNQLVASQDGFPKAIGLSDKRIKSILARDKELQSEYKISWEVFFGVVAASDFLAGKCNNDSHPNFRADLDWLMKPDNFLKVIERKYDNKKPVQTAYDRY